MIANRSYDCVVIGAGPGGGTAAALVAEHGFSTLLVERDKMPRFHVGESLMPETYWIFERLGILHELDKTGFTRKNGVQFVNSSGKETAPFIFREMDDRDCSESWHVKRDKFDQLLYETAYNRGATCSDETRVLDIDIRNKSPHRVTLKTADGKEQEISARVIIDASGQQALLASRLGLKEYYPDLKKAAIWGYFEGAQRAGGGKPEVTCILHTSSKDAWFWYIPLGDGTVSVGLVGDNDFVLKRGNSPQQTFEEQVNNCAGVKRRLLDANQVGRLNVAKEFSYRTTQQAGDGWVLVGDAGGFIDPIYSSGVYLALKSAVMAADAVTDGLHRNDVSEKQLGCWTRDYEKGVELIRRLVRAFYTKEFSFGQFMKAHPQHVMNLTNLLVGRVFEGNAGKIFDDMDPWLEKVRAGEPIPEASNS
ncbi:MAG: tryptophan 7-halogenase [Mariniblastus sp.]|nr:tryptophan 7-halogenase [Mariniblastus sp.]